MSRKTYYWNEKTFKWEESPSHSNQSPLFNIHVFKGQFNHSLGAYVGSKEDIKAAQGKIEQKTGSRPVEVGSERMNLKPQRQEYRITQDMIESVKNR
jgi:hypothetical protein